MRYERVRIKRDTNTIHNRAVPDWEIPVLEYLFDRGNVEKTGIFVEVAGDYPDPREEFERLAQRYGSDNKSGTPHICEVYGTAMMGVRALSKAIDEAKAADEEAAGATKAPARRARAGSRSAPSDSLLA